tara:strand:+ start:15011 stop:16654 length:1644 start_codon:yes stop_codon:yes gene_type:complete
LNVSNYIKTAFKGDLAGGISSAIIVLPAAIGFGLATGLGAISGIVGAIFLGYFSALFGGTKTQISTPSGSMTVVIAYLVIDEVAIKGDLASSIPFLFLVFIITGLIQISLGLSKLGDYIRYIPYPVISGFISGIGAIIVIMQVNEILGVHIREYKVISTFYHLDEIVQNADFSTVFLGLFTMFIFYLVKWKFEKLSPLLLALIISSVLAYFLQLDVVKIGHPDFTPPDFVHADLLHLDLSHWVRATVTAFSLAILGGVNSLLTSVVADRITKQTHNSNKELIGQGIGNAIAGIFGGIPGAGATATTITNIKSGGTTRVSGLISATTLTIIFFFGWDFIAEIPFSVVSALLFVIGLSLIDWDNFKSIKLIPKADVYVMLLVFILTIFWNLLYAVMLGVFLASIQFLKKMADEVELGNSKTVIDKQAEEIIDKFKDADLFREKVKIKTIHGPLFFGFSHRFYASTNQLEKSTEHVVFNFSIVSHIDQSGMMTFNRIINLLNEKKINFYITEIKKEHQLLLAQRFPDIDFTNKIYKDMETCLNGINNSFF